MRTSRSYVVAAASLQAALLLAGCTGGRDDAAAGNSPVAAVSPAPAPVSRPRVAVTGPARTILAFGDSLYAGYRLERGESLPAVIERRLRERGINVTVVNAGVSGDTSADGRRRLAYTLDRLDHAPDLVLLGLGGNDVLRQVPPAETRANLQAMLTELERRRIPVVLTGMLAPPNLGPTYSGAFNAIYPALAREHRATLDPFILAGVIGNRRLMLGDGVHPNAHGVDVIADRLTPLVEAQVRTLPAA